MRYNFSCFLLCCIWSSHLYSFFHSLSAEADNSVQTELKIPTDDNQPILRLPLLHEDMGQSRKREVLSKSSKVVPKLVSKVEVDNNTHSDSYIDLQSESSNEFDLDFLDTPQESIIRKSLAALPAKNRPANLEAALAEMKAGEKVFEFLQKQQLGEAIMMNFPSEKEINRSKALLAHTFNMNDTAFWNLIENDPEIKASVLAHNMSFTFDAFKNPEFNMSFRMIYIRKNMKKFSTTKEEYEANMHECELAYQKALIQLQWYLFSRAILQDQAFTSGMITFQDPQDTVFRFIDGYGELVSRRYKSFGGMAAHSLVANKAYTRESSHWNGQKAFGNKNFGIDIKNSKNKPMSVLPGNKSHLLFGMRTNGMTFVKWEEYGTTFNVKTGDYSVIHHTFRYFEKKDLQDDPTLHRREKVSADIMKYFNRVYGKTLTKQQTERVETNGIAEMLKMLDAKSPELVVKFKKYLVQEFGYQPDTLHLRKGGEIILPASDVAPLVKTSTAPAVVKPIVKTASVVSAGSTRDSSFDDL